MFVLATFRTIENSCLLLYAILLIIPAVVALWAFLRYPEVHHYSAAVFGSFVILAAVPLVFWIQNNFIFLVVAAILVAPLIVAIKATRRDSNLWPLAAVLVVLIVLTLDLLAGAERWHAGKVRLYWLPADPLTIVVLMMLGYLALLPAYFVLSIAMWAAISTARRRRTLASVSCNNVHS